MPSRSSRKVAAGSRKRGALSRIRIIGTNETVNTDVTALVEKLRGRFLVFDGPDGAGKSTQREMFEAALRRAGAETVSCRDPGGTEIGNRIRSVLLDFDLSAMDVNCEALLFMASRAQLIAQVVRPALEAGTIVLCDRFVSSTCAYQGAAGLDPTRVLELARFAIGDCWPDATVILDVGADEGFGRIGRKPHHAGKNRKDDGQQTLFDDAGPDAMEARSIDYHRRVRQMFLDLPDYYPGPALIVDGRDDKDAIHQRIVEELSRVFA